MRFLKMASIVVMIISVVILPGCSGKSAKSAQPNRPPAAVEGGKQKSPGEALKIELTKDMSEDQAYLALKEGAQSGSLPVYRPLYTAGFSFTPTDPWGKLDSGKDNNVWYRKGQIYFRIVNNLAGNIGNAKTMRIGMVNGKPAVMTVNGLVAKWDEVHNAAGSNKRLSYGVEVFRGSALPRGEVIKIVKSMKPVE